jgi:hypothetical protein
MKPLLSTLLFVATSACAEPPLHPSIPVAKSDGATATVRVDPTPGAKRFQGVWLESADGSKQLIAYNKRSVWAQFEGQTVVVTGAPYQPEGQSISADHFRVETLSLADSSAATLYTSVGPIKALTGDLTLQSGSPGSKMAGQSWWVFSSGGLSYQLANPSAVKGQAGAITVKARRIERSPFTAHMPGPLLWIESVK